MEGELPGQARSAGFRRLRQREGVTTHWDPKVLFEAARQDSAMGWEGTAGKASRLSPS